MSPSVHLWEAAALTDCVVGRRWQVQGRQCGVAVAGMGEQSFVDADGAWEECRAPGPPEAADSPAGLLGTSTAEHTCNR